MTMQELLFNAVEQQILRHLDAQFAMMVASNDEPAVMLAAAILSQDTGEGHVCLPLSRLLVNDKTPAPLQSCFALLGPVNWPQVLLRSTAVSEGNATPIILSAERLYLNRMWRSEQVIAKFFSKTNQKLSYDKWQLIHTLNELFGTSEFVNWQKIAVAVALTRRISVISGGPGTGKTTTVAKLLTALIQLAGEKRYRIKLAAPTGKAAAHLTESIGDMLNYLPLTASQRKCFPSEASTIHYLLGAQSNSQRLRYHTGNTLNLDVLVIDEASMVGLNMMSHLIKALPLHARVIFLGDRDQLTSVEAGSVLGDVCAYAKEGYTVMRAHELTQITGCPIEGNPNLVSGMLHDSLCLLQKNYRFDSNSGIGQLSMAVNRGDYQAVKIILDGTFNDIKRMVLQTGEDYLRMLEEILEGYLCFLRCVHQQEDPEKILATFSQFRLLCALRKGLFGVAGLNEQLEQVLYKTRNINRHPNSCWYEGRPVMILRNDSTMGLFNGDIGIVLNRNQELRVWFQLPNGSMKSFQPSRLPEHETAWAMTVHKSQGSEFDHVALILPIQIMSILTRELIYTAITRARKRLSLYGSDCVLMQAIITRTERRSGLSMIFEST